MFSVRQYLCHKFELTEAKYDFMQGSYPPVNCQANTIVIIIIALVDNRSTLCSSQRSVRTSEARIICDLLLCRIFSLIDGKDDDDDGGGGQGFIVYINQTGSERTIPMCML